MTRLLRGPDSPLRYAPSPPPPFCLVLVLASKQHTLIANNQTRLPSCGRVSRVCLLRCWSCRRRYVLSDRLSVDFTVISLAMLLPFTAAPLVSSVKFCFQGFRGVIIVNLSHTLSSSLIGWTAAMFISRDGYPTVSERLDYHTRCS